MTATVRLDDALESKLETLSKSLHKKKSDVIREAILFYANSFETSQKRRMLQAVEKTLQADSQEAKLLEETLHDGL
ncbi:MAG: CopG family transcriptional regulator [Sulfurovum sp. PC08-66]|nr:MAG: CopG family transcriptional regulator [Sulfurovum sp. PC08-66]KIM12667.1 MAG: CopG family transcriptional regulator [Sulfuricurvum sp. PC08-66]